MIVNLREADHGTFADLRRPTRIDRRRCRRAGTTGAMPDPLPAVARFAAEAGEEPVGGALRARFDQVGSGYGDLVESVAAAMSLIATTEGIVLDPIYTGRALAGLIAAVDDGDITSGSTTVFMHTGGLPGLFGHPVTVSYAQSLLQTFG